MQGPRGPPACSVMVFLAGSALVEGREMEAILSVLGAVILVLVSLTAVLGLVILVLHEARYIIRLSARLGTCATNVARRREA